MNYSIVLENNLILGGLSDKIILNIKPNYIKKIYKTILDGDKYTNVTLYDIDSSGSMLCNEHFTDNDINIMYKFDINPINKLNII